MLTADGRVIEGVDEERTEGGRGREVLEREREH